MIPLDILSNSIPFIRYLNAKSRRHVPRLIETKKTSKAESEYKKKQQKCLYYISDVIFGRNRFVSVRWYCRQFAEYPPRPSQAVRFRYDNFRCNTSKEDTSLATVPIRTGIRENTFRSLGDTDKNRNRPGWRSWIGVLISYR